jgi:phospholipase C
MHCRFTSSIAASALALFFAGCGANGSVSPWGAGLQNGGGSLPPASRMHHHSSSGKIQHIIIVVQENRSFNNLFYGFPGATTSPYGYTSNGQQVTLQPIGLETTWDIEHDSSGYFAACDGTGSIPGTDCKMDGFNNEYQGCRRSCPQYPEYAYVPHTETKPLFTIGKQYVLADQMYASNFDASSFISHQYIISGQAEGAVNFPWSSWGCPGGSGDKIGKVGPQRQIPDGYEVVCWDPTTLGDELDSAGISWAFYTSSISGNGGIWSAYQAINHIYNGPDWSQDIITPQTNFFNDVSNGKLRAVSWITPTCQNSDHAGCGSNTGPAWIASLVNAIGKSQYWDSTAMFIFWDDYGGWYDPEPPAYADYDGLGMRIPMLIVSAYARKHYVSHTHYEHGTILKFVEETFGLPALAASDARANPPDDSFNFNQSPRKFKKIPSKQDVDFFMHQPLDLRPPDTQ